MKLRPKTSYLVSVRVKHGDRLPYLVTVETNDDVGAMLLAQLLKEHDPEVDLMEVSMTRETRDIAVRKWPRKRKS